MVWVARSLKLPWLSRNWQLLSIEHRSMTKGSSLTLLALGSQPDILFVNIPEVLWRLLNTPQCSITPGIVGDDWVDWGIWSLSLITKKFDKLQFNYACIKDRCTIAWHKWVLGLNRGAIKGNILLCSDILQVKDCFWSKMNGAYFILSK